MRELAGEYVYQEILEQRGVAAARAAAPPPTWPESAGRIVVSGSGDSLCAAELLAALYPDRALQPMSALAAAGRRWTPDDALLAVSVSGRTPRVIEAALRARRRGATVVAVTDDPDSPLAEHADALWAIGAAPPRARAATRYQSAEARQYVGYQHDVAQTKSFCAVLLTMARAAEGSAAATDWSAIADRIGARTGDAAIAPLLQAAPRWAEAGQAFLLGSGAALPLMRFATYKLFEFNRIAHWSDLEEYCHTHYFVTRPGDAVVFAIADADAAHRAGEIAPVLAELFDARLLWIHPEDVDCPIDTPGDAVVLPAAASPLERAVDLLLAVEWITYLWGRIAAPDINTFHAGYDTERLVAASMRAIRRSAIRP